MKCNYGNKYPKVHKSKGKIKHELETLVKQAIAEKMLTPLIERNSKVNEFEKVDIKPLADIIYGEYGGR